MNNLLLAISAESLKIKKSKVFWLTIAALSMAPLFGAIFVIVLRTPELSAGNEALRAKATLTGFSPDWPSFLHLIAQAIGIGGVIVFGFISSWIFGREYSDHTLKDLLTLPIKRSTIVLSKFICSIIWAFIVTISVVFIGLLAGYLLKLEGFNSQIFFSSLIHVFLTAALAICLSPPVFLVASAAKGYLAPLGFVILTVVMSQIIGALGFGSYFPWAIPALFSGFGSLLKGNLTTISYLIVITTGLTGLFGTILWWKYSDHNY